MRCTACCDSAGDYYYHWSERCNLNNSGPWCSVGPAYKSTVYGAYTWASIAFLLGMLAFFVSLGISGWVRSPKLGIFSSTLSGAAITGVAYFLMFVVRGL